MRRRPSSLVLWLNEQMIGAQDPKVGTPERSRRSSLSASAKRLKSGEFVKAKIPIQLKSGESTVQVLCAVVPRRKNITTCHRASGACDHAKHECSRLLDRCRFMILPDCQTV